MSYQKQKLLWDESWIIDFAAIKDGNLATVCECSRLRLADGECVFVDPDARVTVGSIMSALVGKSDSNTSCLTALSSCTGQAGTRRTLFTCTGIQ